MTKMWSDSSVFNRAFNFDSIFYLVFNHIRRVRSCYIVATSAVSPTSFKAAAVDQKHEYVSILFELGTINMRYVALQHFSSNA